MPAIAGTRRWVLGRMRADRPLSVAVLALLLLALLALPTGAVGRVGSSGRAPDRSLVELPPAAAASTASGALARGAALAPSTNDSPIRWVRVNGSAPEPLVDPAYASNSVMGMAVLFGGYRNTTPPCSLLTTCAQGSTWVWSSGNWQNVTSGTGGPPASWGGSMVYDPVLGVFVEFGGVTAEPNGGNNPAIGSTYEFSTTRDLWTALNPPNSPSARWDAGAVWDPTLGDVVVFGGLTTQLGVVTPLNDTWAFDGSKWTNITGTSGPTARSSPAMTWDNQTDSALLYGGFPANSETWSLSGDVWRELHPSVTPGALGGASAVTDPVNGTVTLVGGCATDPCTTGPVNRTWSFTDGEWFELRAIGNVGPEGRDHAAIFPTAAPAMSLLLGGDVGGRPANDSWALYHLEVGEVTSSATEAEIGRPVNLSVNWDGGIGPATYRWLGLPPGCASENTSSLTCTATGTGPLDASIRVVVSDAPGLSVESPALSLEFAAQPSVLLEALPTHGVVPLQVTFSAILSGGTGTVTLSWNFGDGAVGLGTNPSHTYETPGRFDASVWANDSSGVSNRTNVTIEAVAPLALTLKTSGADFTVGGASTIVANITGGMPPYSVATPGLPAGCSHVTSLSWNCSIRIAGNYPISFVATDQSGQTARANTTLSVSAAPAPPPAKTNTLIPSGLLGPALVVIGALVAALAIGFVLARRRRRRRGPPKAWTSVPVPDPADLPTVGGSLYLPPRPKPGKRRP